MISPTETIINVGSQAAQFQVGDIISVGKTRELMQVMRVSGQVLTVLRNVNPMSRGERAVRQILREVAEAEAPPSQE